MTLWERWRKTTVANQAAIVTGSLVALGTVFYAGAAAVQIKIIKDGSRSTENQLAQVIASADRVVKSVEKANEDNRLAMQRTLEQMKRQADASLIQADAGKATADASKAANDLAGRGIRQNLESARLDQRAWLAIQPCTMSKELDAYPTAPDGSLRPSYTQQEIDGTTARVQCPMNNSGRTPALNVRTWSQAAIGVRPLLAWKDSDGSGREIAFPGGAHGLTMDKFVLAPEVNRLYRLGAILFILLRAEYEDVWHNKHWTQACYSRKFNDGLSAFTFCGGEIDQ